MVGESAGEAISSAVDQIHWWTAMFSLALLTMVLVLKRLAPAFPGSLLAVVVAGVASVVLDLPALGLAVVGDLPAGVPPLTAPDVPLSVLEPGEVWAGDPVTVETARRMG